MTTYNLSVNIRSIRCKLRTFSLLNNDDNFIIIVPRTLNVVNHAASLKQEVVRTLSVLNRNDNLQFVCQHTVDSMQATHF